MPSTPSDMLEYYHGCLLECLQEVQNFQAQRQTTQNENLRSALVTLQGSVRAVRDAMPAHSDITSSGISTLQTNFATAQAEWTARVGKADMYDWWCPSRRQFVSKPSPGQDNMLIYAVTQLLADCLTYLQNIQAVLSKARALAPPPTAPGPQHVVEWS